MQASTATKPDPDEDDDELLGLAIDSSDLSSEEEDDVKASPGKRRERKKGSDKVLELGNILKAPRATQYATKAFHTMIKDDLVDLEPEYQRGVVWPEHKQSAVIESIMRHYYVPPVLLSVKDREDGETTYVCIDGKQRLSSVQLFMDNKIPVKEPGTNRKFWYKEDLLAGKTPALTPAQRRRFDNEQLTCVEFDGLTDEIERDMFSRVQMGVTLSSAEKLAAHLGGWPDLIRTLVKRFLDATPDHPGLSTDRKGNLIMSVTRGKDYLFMAQITLLIVHAREPKYIPTAGRVESFLKANAEKSPSAAVSKDIHDTLARYVALANHPRWGRCIKPQDAYASTGRVYSRPLAPVEFVYIGFLIYKFRHAELNQLYQMIEDLKEEVRPKFKDVMFNSRVAVTLRTFIDNVKLPPPLPEGDAVPKGYGKKRARASTTDDDSEDGEYRPTRTARRSLGGSGATTTTTTANGTGAAPAQLQMGPSSSTLPASASAAPPRAPPSTSNGASYGTAPYGSHQAAVVPPPAPGSVNPLSNFTPAPEPLRHNPGWGENFYGGGGGSAGGNGAAGGGPQHRQTPQNPYQYR